MSVLVIGGRDATADAVVRRLVGEGDEVRVIEDDAGRGDELRALGAFVARGDAGDFDLVERAAQNVRTVVVLGAGWELEPILRGARAAAVDRIVWCGTRGAVDPGVLEAGGFDYVLMHVPPPARWRRAPRIPEDALADAISAADDLAGNPRLVLDLASADAWSALGLAPPGGDR
jgi:hypothetical protein